MNILLIGYRGSGKTTIGRRLADAISRPFVDLDERTMAGFEETSARVIWATHGEAAWRAREEEALHEVLTEQGLVVALGGGTPMIPGARAAIEREQRAGRARVVYLRCRGSVLRERLVETTGDRPSLTGASVIAEITRVLEHRAPTYEALADVIHENDGLGPDAAVQAILESISDDTTKA